MGMFLDSILLLKIKAQARDYCWLVKNSVKKLNAKSALKNLLGMSFLKGVRAQVELVA